MEFGIGINTDGYIRQLKKQPMTLPFIAPCDCTVYISYSGIEHATYFYVRVNDVTWGNYSPLGTAGSVAAPMNKGDVMTFYAQGSDTSLTGLMWVQN